VSLNSRRWLHAFLMLVAAAFAWPGAARAAACNGAVLTANTTQYWTWVRVLDPTKTVVLDSGFIAPHSTKSWSGPGARGACGFPVYFQYQVTSSTSAAAPTSIGTPLADVAAGSLMALPASVLAADLKMVPTGKPSGATASVLAPFWLTSTDTQGAINAMTGPLNALSCLKTADNKYFAVDDSTYCSKPPVLRPPTPPMPEVAGCGTIVTLNQTDHWAWITIYPLDHEEHYDWGWVAPHNFRAWHAGGAPTPMSFMCGSFYFVRYEIKQGRMQANPADGPNIFDTTMEINPQLSLGHTLLMLGSIGKTLRCVTSPAAGVECAAEWGMDEGALTAIFGMVGSEAEGSVVCIKSSDDTSFWLENTSNCATPPANGKVPPPGTPPKHVYAFSPGSRTVGIGAAPSWRFNITVDGTTITDVNVYNKCAFVSDNPGIAKFDDPHIGRIHGVKKGTVAAHWTCGGKTIASGKIVVE
jgi:hypothetical protein